MQRIVIIGAGFAGVTAVKTLASSLTSSDATEVVLLGKTKFFYHSIGAPRAFVDAGYVANMFVPYDNVIPETSAGFVRRIRAMATGISAEKKEVSYQVIDDDDTPAVETKVMAFDYLVLAMGSSYVVPIKEHPDVFSVDYTRQKLDEVREQIINAESILLVGGGGVGCELAGEIAAYFPDKQVTLLQSHNRLCSSRPLSEEFHATLMQSLDKLKVKVIVGERLSERLTTNVFERRMITTDKGTTIETDIQLLCGGFQPKSEIVFGMDASMVDDNGQVRVNEFLQLDEAKYSSFFALGDLTDHPAPKSARWARRQGEYVAEVLVSRIRNKDSEAPKAFDFASSNTMSLSLGPNGGVTQRPDGKVYGDSYTQSSKSFDLGAARIWGILNAQMP